MHRLSKKERNSGEPETLQRSRNPTTVVTANGEVQTEVQEDDHDLHLFVTVKFLEDTLAVLSVIRYTLVSGPVVKNHF